MLTKRKILVIDDERLVRDLLKSILEHANYNVLIAEDGLSGIEIATAERPDLVIVDGLLPKVHGFLACKAIKKLIPAPKVILLTGIYTKLSYKWEVKSEYEADELLAKPTKPAELLACVEKHLADAPDIDPSSSATQPPVSEHPSQMSGVLTNEHASDSKRPAGYSATWIPKLIQKSRLVPSS